MDNSCDPRATWHRLVAGLGGTTALTEAATPAAEFLVAFLLTPLGVGTRGPSGEATGKLLPNGAAAAAQVPQFDPAAPDAGVGPREVTAARAYGSLAALAPGEFIPPALESIKVALDRTELD